MQYPLSTDEHAAMVRHLSGLRKKIHEVSDLLTARYGRDSSIADIAVKSLVAITLLEHELVIVDGYPDLEPEVDTMQDLDPSLLHS